MQKHLINWSIFWGSILICLYLYLHAAYALAGESVENLLQQANSALSGQKGSSSSDDKSAQKSPKKININTQKETQKNTDVQNAAKDKDTEKPQKETLRAMNTAELDKILFMELEQQKKDAKPIDPQITTSLMLGVSRVESGYEFTKDDDTFKVEKNASLKGGKVGLVPSWSISNDYLSAHNLATRSLLALEIGYLSGHLPVERSGIESGKDTYEYRVIPLDLALGLSLENNKNIGVRAFYGFGSEIVSQTGQGDSDTLSEYFMNDTLTAQAFFRLTPRAEFSFCWQKRGSGLVKFAKNSSGQVFGLGFGLMSHASSSH